MSPRTCPSQVGCAAAHASGLCFTAECLADDALADLAIAHVVELLEGLGTALGHRLHQLDLRVLR